MIYNVGRPLNCYEAQSGLEFVAVLIPQPLSAESIGMYRHAQQGAVLPIRRAMQCCE